MAKASPFNKNAPFERSLKNSEYFLVQSDFRTDNVLSYDPSNQNV